MLLNTRGSLWDRLALNLDSHLRDKADAFEVIQTGIADPDIGDKDRLLLQVSFLCEIDVLLAYNDGANFLVQSVTFGDCLFNFLFREVSAILLEFAY